MDERDVAWPGGVAQREGAWPSARGVPQIEGARLRRRGCDISCRGPDPCKRAHPSEKCGPEGDVAPLWGVWSRGRGMVQPKASRLPWGDWVL